MTIFFEAGAIPFSQLWQPHQYTTVSANSSVEVYYAKIPESCVAFIELKASNFYKDTYFMWYVDGKLVEGNIERQMGLMSTPTVIDPPVLVKDEIKVIMFNNSDEDLDVEVLMDGILYHEKSVRNVRNGS